MLKDNHEYEIYAMEAIFQSSPEELQLSQRFEVVSPAPGHGVEFLRSGDYQIALLRVTQRSGHRIAGQLDALTPIHQSLFLIAFTRAKRTSTYSSDRHG